MTASSLGIGFSDFKHMTPKKLFRCVEGYKIRKEQRDNEMWLWFGSYGISAFTVAIDRCFSKHPRVKYVENPILSTAEEVNKPMSEEELQRQRELFVAKLEVMKTNFELNHNNNK